MDRIEVKILQHNLDGTAKFLARLTQRGHKIESMDDVTKLYEECVNTHPSEYLLDLPHTTIKRMNYITVAISGLSTKAVSQLRTHAKRLTFISTSTQYSSFDGKDSANYVMPRGLDAKQDEYLTNAYVVIQALYEHLLKLGVDKDEASYLLPQGLRKTLVVSGNLDDWQYVIKTRLCNRNTKEVQHIVHLIYEAIKTECGEEFVVGMLPPCTDGACKEGKFCCGKKFDLNEV
ncbi:MAG: FAD-dependent thymidylate synthase [Bacteroidales bacterium]|nr:FAD-dependent thymidylate synthase [Bacteroidales bacterium]